MVPRLRPLVSLAVAGVTLLATAGPASAETTSFVFTGAAGSFTVPADVFVLRVVLEGAQGFAPGGGKGARVQATLPVTPGQVLAVYVGGQGATTAGGFNGGAAGNDGGGGASDLRAQPGGLADRLLVAGGGGGAGGPGEAYREDMSPQVAAYAGGNGGDSGQAGAPGAGPAGVLGLQGYPGTATAGGGSGGNGTSGSLGAGGAGGPSQGGLASPGGGGGGGLYGGAGGGGGGWFDCTACSPSRYDAGAGGGGGGGSSFASVYASGVSVTQGARSGDGQVTLEYVAQAPGSPGNPPAGGETPGGGGQGGGTNAAPTVTSPLRASTRVDSRGGFIVPGTSIECPATGPACAVTARGTAVLDRRRAQTVGRTSFTIQPGKTGKVKLKLTRKARARLNRKRKLKTTVKIIVTQGAQKVTKSVVVTLRPRAR